MDQNVQGNVNKVFHYVDMNRVLTSRIDQGYPNYMNVASVSQIQPQAPSFSVNNGFTVLLYYYYYVQSNQSFQSIYPRLQVQNETTDEQPIYVNAKQYNRIILRRKARAKWESEHRVTKKDKPYMHESRHEHALRRIRGADGRFLKKNEIEAMVSRVVICFYYYLQGELKLNDSGNPQLPASLDRSGLSMQFSNLPASVDSSIPNYIQMSIPIEHSQQEAPNMNDKSFQF